MRKKVLPGPLARFSHEVCGATAKHSASAWDHREASEGGA
jgi:hypothetical protein